MLVSIGRNALLALLLLNVQQTTVQGQTCDRELVAKRPITCQRAMPCYYMLPILQEEFPSDWTKQEITDKSGSCDCLNHVCQQATVVVQSEVIRNVSCLPATCFEQKDPIVMCTSARSCRISYPSPPIKHANDWQSDTECTCVEGVCQAIVTVGLDHSNATRLLVPCRGLQTKD